jgi:hypothetical protein
MEISGLLGNAEAIKGNRGLDSPGAVAPYLQVVKLPLRMSVTPGYRQHGHSTKRNFIYVTIQNL